MRKPTFFICENKVADHFRSKCEANQRLFFATRIVQFLIFLNLKSASSHLLYLYNLVCVRTVRKPHCWFSHAKAHIHFPVKEAVSNICEKIEAVLNISADQLRAKEQHFVLDTDNLGISKDVLKVTDVVLNFICETVHTTYSARNVDFTWLSALLKGLSQYAVLIKDLFKRIWSLIFSQVNTTMAAVYQHLHPTKLYL